MKHIYFYASTCSILLLAILMTAFVLNTGVSAKTKFDSIPSKFPTKTEHLSYLKNGLKAALPVIKPIQNQVIITKQASVKVDNEKMLTDVMIYPNPMTDKINLSYTLKKNTNVSIKIMDILGNDVLTLMSQRLDAGEQKNTFQLSNRISPGFYFVRIIVGTEPFIKRISIL